MAAREMRRVSVHGLPWARTASITRTQKKALKSRSSVWWRSRSSWNRRYSGRTTSKASSTTAFARDESRKAADPECSSCSAWAASQARKASHGFASPRAMKWRKASLTPRWNFGSGRPSEKFR